MPTLTKILSGFALVLALAACAAAPTSEAPPTVPTLAEVVAEEPALTSFVQLADALALDLDEPWIVAEFATYTLMAPSNDLLDVYASEILGDGNDADDLVALAASLESDAEARTLLRLFTLAHFVPGTHLSDRLLGGGDGVNDFVYWVHQLDGDTSLFAEVYTVDRAGERIVGITPDVRTGTLGQLYLNPDDLTFGSVDVAFDRGIVHVIAGADVCCTQSPF